MLEVARKSCPVQCGSYLPCVLTVMPYHEGPDRARQLASESLKEMLLRTPPPYRQELGHLRDACIQCGHVRLWALELGLACDGERDGWP